MRPPNLCIFLLALKFSNPANFWNWSDTVLLLTELPHNPKILCSNTFSKIWNIWQKVNACLIRCFFFNLNQYGRWVNSEFSYLCLTTFSYFKVLHTVIITESQTILCIYFRNQYIFFQIMSLNLTKVTFNYEIQATATFQIMAWFL